MRVVATLSTIPSRIDRIRPTIESLLRQTHPVEKVELNIPMWCVRTAEPYKVPEWMTSMVGVEVHRTEDYGAITKVAPTLIRHDKEEVYVWSVDDDFVYHPTHLETLLKGVDGQSIVCLHGGIWTPHGFAGGQSKDNRVDIVEGFFGIVYPPNCIREDFLGYVEKTSANWDNRKSDDIILSNYFALHRVPMIKIRYDPRVFRIIETEQTYGSEPQALKNQDDGHHIRYSRVLDWLRVNGLCGWRDLPAMVNRQHPVFPRPKRPPPYYSYFPKPVVPVRIPITTPSYFCYALKGKKKADVKTNE